MAQRGFRCRAPTPACVAAFTLVTLLLVRSWWSMPTSATKSMAVVTTSSRERVFVERVIDGDTFDASGGKRIRLLGVDAPESGFGGTAPEPWCDASTAWLSQQVAHQYVTLEISEVQHDRYGRTLAWVYTDDGTLVNAALLRSGMARLLADFGLPEILEPQLRRAEAEARVRRLGIWSSRN